MRLSLTFGQAAIRVSLGRSAGRDGSGVWAEGGVEALGEVADAEPVERTIAQDTAGGDELLVQTLTVSADEHQPAVGGEDLVPQGRIGNADARDAGEAALVAPPHFGAQKAGGHRDERVVEVREDDVGALRGVVGVERDRALPVVGVVEVDDRARPGAGQGADVEDGRAVAKLGDQVGLATESEAGADHAFDIGRGAVQLTSAVVEGRSEAFGLLTQLALHLEGWVSLCLRKGPVDVEVSGRSAEHLALNGIADDWVNAAEVFAGSRDLAGDDGEELKIALQAVLRCGLPVAPGEVIDEWDLRLAITVDSAGALFEPVGVEGRS